MNTEFPRIMTLRRKERKISQKQAAADLGISQALLSHYEKGIRECGLDFLVKAADYYNVSCDYLLGRTASPDEKFSQSDSDENICDDIKMISDSRKCTAVHLRLSRGQVSGKGRCFLYNTEFI